MPVGKYDHCQDAQVGVHPVAVSMDIPWWPGARCSPLMPSSMLAFQNFDTSLEGVGRKTLNQLSKHLQWLTLPGIKFPAIR